jgi:hypothetical protein
MDIKYTWSIQSIHVIPSLSDGYNNIVKKIYWSLNAINEQFVSDFLTGVATVDIFSDKSNFISYSDLTEEQIISWVHEILGEEEINNMKKILEDRIQSTLDHPTVMFPLPWVSYLSQEVITSEFLPELLPELPETTTEIIDVESIPNSQEIITSEVLPELPAATTEEVAPETP